MIAQALGLLSLVSLALGAAFASNAGDEDEKAQQDQEPKKTRLDPPPAPSITSHQITIGDQPLRYRATAGLMPIFNEQGDLQANLSFVAYHAGDTPHGDASRPLIFLFNGGPGSSSVWLHLGGLGPRRVRMEDDGTMPRPPFQIVDNEHTWLTFADLVYIDPIDTGYSQAASDELAKKFRSVKGDLELTGEFIRRYLTEHQRWSSPLFLAGESYGTFRVAGLAGYLIEKGIAFNGVILISSVLELGTLLFESGDDLPYTVYLPTYVATAWYHKRLDKDLLDRSLDDLVHEVEQWAMSEYTVALAQGSSLPDHQRAEIVKRLARYTGLSETFIQQNNLRVHGERFAKELLRAEGTIVGRLDSRLTGFDADTGNDLPAFDPSMSAIRFPFTAAINHYMRTELNYEHQREYQILRGLSWEWGSAHEGTPRTNKALRDAFAHNPYLHVLVTSGYYDLATPFAATRYTMRRLDVAPSIRDQIRLIDYPAGHMLYLPIEQMAKLRDDTAEFVRDALATGSPST